MRDEAVAWAVRVDDPGFADWDGFTAWLEADARHAEAYDHAVLAAEAADAGLIVPASTPVIRPAPALRQPLPRRRALGWLGGAVAASLVAVAGVQVFQDRAQPYAVETAAGETRVIALADGSRVALNGGTRLTLDRADAREVTLERGEALFTVAHDDRDPFTVHAGNAEIVDLGTVFNVVREGGETRVGVAEGLVAYNPDAENVRLEPGETLVDAQGVIRLGRAATGDIGGWKAGRLVYEGAPLTQVAGDLARATGTRVAVAPAIAARQFTGVIALPEKRAGFVAELGPLLDVEVQPGEQGVTLSPRNRVAP
ncbi:DUF4880 domain-containing protein [Sphingomonas gilva]|uniref:DUF4880 domain-containing protein n=2 Tax=Sphingomonas gilva TaxID=2305907 RepID=A0A396RS23_9SPHN|nr:DUF4880 domain-containing protein [Sphingomonas gilva]